MASRWMAPHYAVSACYAGCFLVWVDGSRGRSSFIVHLATQYVFARQRGGARSVLLERGNDHCARPVSLGKNVTRRRITLLRSIRRHHAFRTSWAVARIDGETTHIECHRRTPLAATADRTSDSRDSRTGRVTRKPCGWRFTASTSGRKNSNGWRGD